MSFIIWTAMSLSVLAVGVDEKRLSNPVDEARAQEVMKQLRCLVCQNQSIVDSDAGLARDIRIIVRERIIAGDSDADVLRFMTDRYGDWVLLKPPFDGV
ncbi:MAG: cytochrome c-type biogenesis protein CcmH [Emcibacteraceae bacterium]|nr:cytochrome c-type biogenesis protein CcmH [Emcibacteraceae bacterium]